MPDRVLVESEFGVSADHELKRHEVMNYLPKIVGDVEPHHSICTAARMEGKIVEKVEFGMREDIEGEHQSETLRLEFTDGEILAMDTRSNASDLEYNTAMKPDEFQVYFALRWVPAASEKRHEIIASLPKIVGDVESHYSICEATRMVGKTVEKVEFGKSENQSELLCIKFADGDILGLDTGLSTANFEFNSAMELNELQVYFMLRWVEAPSNR